MSDLLEAIFRTANEIVDRIEALPDTGARRVIAIAGPPGSGKSTLAAAAVAELMGRGHNSFLMPMDGFHLDDRILEPLGLLPRKGAPETFDFGGFITAIRRVREEPSVFLPVFDRSREIAIAAAEQIRPETRIIVVEGNYLVLDEDPWCALQPFWDLTVFLEVSIDELERRLIDRWLSYGFDPDAATTKARENDLKNASRIKCSVGHVDMVVQN